MASGDLHGKSQGLASKKKLEHIQKDSERFRKLIRWKAKLRRRQRKAMSPMPFLRSPSATFTVSVSMNLFVNLWWTGRALAKERFEASANQTKYLQGFSKHKVRKYWWKSWKRRWLAKAFWKKEWFPWLICVLCSLGVQGLERLKLKVMLQATKKPESQTSSKTGEMLGCRGSSIWKMQWLFVRFKW